MAQGETETLTDADIEYLQGCPQFERFIEQLKSDLAECRREADTISAAGLPTLQGRIIALKNIIHLFF